MKLQYALPLLSAAASFMVLGVVLSGPAAAQEPQEQPTNRPNVRVRATPNKVIRTPRVTPTQRRNNGGNAAGGTDAQEASGDEGSSGAAGLTEFETGVEYEPVSPRTRVTFNLEEADLPDLVRLISNLTGKRFILPGKVRSIKATVFAPTKVSVSEAYNAFLSILEVNGLTVVPAGRYLKIMESSNIENQPIPLHTGGSPTPSQDRFITRLHRVSNVSAEDVAASFQEAVVDVLVTKTRQAAMDVGAKGICIGGGVAANSRLREQVLTVCAEDGFAAYIPERANCTDNAAMVAAAGWWRLQQDGPSPMDTGADPNLALPV